MVSGRQRWMLEGVIRRWRKGWGSVCYSACRNGFNAFGDLGGTHFYHSATCIRNLECFVSGDGEESTPHKGCWLEVIVKIWPIGELLSLSTGGVFNDFDEGYTNHQKPALLIMSI